MPPPDRRSPPYCQPPTAAAVAAPSEPKLGLWAAPINAAAAASRAQSMRLPPRAAPKALPSPTAVQWRLLSLPRLHPTAGESQLLPGAASWRRVSSIQYQLRWHPPPPAKGQATRRELTAVLTSGAPPRLMRAPPGPAIHTGPNHPAPANMGGANYPPARYLKAPEASSCWLSYCHPYTWPPCPRLPQLRL